MATKVTGRPVYLDETLGAEPHSLFQIQISESCTARFVFLPDPDKDLSLVLEDLAISGILRLIRYRQRFSPVALS
jgi:hypothetical protein